MHIMTGVHLLFGTDQMTRSINFCQNSHPYLGWGVWCRPTFASNQSCGSFVSWCWRYMFWEAKQYNGLAEMEGFLGGSMVWNGETMIGSLTNCSPDQSAILTDHTINCNLCCISKLHIDFAIVAHAPEMFWYVALVCWQVQEPLESN